MFFKKTANQLITPRKTNMSPENQRLEDVFDIKLVPWRIR